MRRDSQESKTLVMAGRGAVPFCYRSYNRNSGLKSVKKWSWLMLYCCPSHPSKNPGGERAWRAVGLRGLSGHKKDEDVYSGLLKGSCTLAALT